MKKFFAVMLAAFSLVVFASCSNDMQESVTFTGTKATVDEFADATKNYDLSKIISDEEIAGRSFYDVTTEDVANASGAKLFRVPGKCTFVLFPGGTIVPIGAVTGGNGVTNPYCFDLDGDGSKEMIFSLSYDSNKTRHGSVKIFDFEEKTENNIMLVLATSSRKYIWEQPDTDFCFEEEDGKLFICKASVSVDESKMQITTTKTERYGQLVYEDGLYKVR